MRRYGQIYWKVVFALVALVGIFFYWYLANSWKSKIYSVASGQPGAGYHSVVEGLMEVSAGKDIAFMLEEKPSHGSVENARLVVSGLADFGLVQLCGEVDDDLRSISHVYDDVLHILKRVDNRVERISDFKGKRLAVGLPGSGTRVVAKQLLDHYGLGDDVVIVDASPESSVKKLISGEVDAVILVTAAQAPVVVDAILSGVVDHFSLGSVGESANEAEGFCQRHQVFKATTVPKHLYGRREGMGSALPREAVSVVSVPSIIVCRKDMDTKVVYEFTRGLYANKHVLAKHSVSMQHLSEPVNFDSFIYPLHDGAKKYYQRRAPGFLVVYAEVIALMLSGSIALIGLMSAVRQWSAVRHKNRIDEYYKKLIVSLRRLRAGEVDGLEEEKMLVDLRAQAYEELVSEKLYANESFRIFQDLLEQCLREARRVR